MDSHSQWPITCSQKEKRFWSWITKESITWECLSDLGVYEVLIYKQYRVLYTNYVLPNWILSLVSIFTSNFSYDEACSWYGTGGQSLYSKVGE